MQIHLIRKEDSLKSNWFIWYCYKEADNKVIYGYCQADWQGECIDEDSFEPEE